ncbi:Hypothetical Protein FCC1311_039212 [Hondaea fermentalgiana]|uniref:Uncharacterized protein n=1 Tax=Hondaea fermentalgiana TaxID=2315210 RepID=A0A2R5GDA2_9STRA|nr:Hypothetical Protein FCC1311_039212 [Hondaea fermentalgiana]|eukprot:GBG27698.1 Hypothetical Protein FCC1311_039212 [Hondaea fermentalgiana]
MEASIQHRIASLRRELADATRLEAELGQRTKNTVRKSDQAKVTSDQETAMLMRRAMYDPIWAIAQVWLSMGVQSSSHVVQSAGLSTQEHAALSQVAQVMVDSKRRVPELSPHVLSGLLQGVRVAIFVRDTVAQREENLKDEAVRPAESAPERREKEAIRKREIAEQRRRESLRKAEERRKAAEAEQAFMERALREEREQMLQEQRRKAAVQEETSRKLAATRAEQEEKRRRKASEERAAQRAKEREIERRRMALADARRTLNAQCEEDVFALREVHLPSALRDLKFGIAQKRVSLVAEQRKLKARRLAIQAQLKEPLVPSAAKVKLRDALATLTQEESTLASSLRGLDDEHKHGVQLLETSMDEREEEIRAQYAALRRDAENEISLCVRDGKL